VSKLFETLEKIRENEVPAGRAKTQARAMVKDPGNRRVLILAGVLIILFLMVLWSYLGRRATHKTKPGPSATTVHSSASLSPAGEPGDPSDLNNLACRLVTKQDYWPAILLLEKANRLTPKRPEPLINIAVALSELGLYGPAAEYLNRARVIAPANQALMKNLAILQEHGIETDPPKRAIRVKVRSQAG